MNNSVKNYNNFNDTRSAKQWPWDKKKSLLFFRGSRYSIDSVLLNNCLHYSRLFIISGVLNPTYTISNFVAGNLWSDTSHIHRGKSTLDRGNMGQKVERLNFWQQVT